MFLWRRILFGQMFLLTLLILIRTQCCTLLCYYYVQIYKYFHNYTSILDAIIVNSIFKTRHNK